MNINELQHISFDIQDRVALVTLNRPDQMNTWTPIMSRELSDAMYECDENDDIRAVVGTGAGRAFCAGADLSVRLWDVGQRLSTQQLHMDREEAERWMVDLIRNNATQMDNAKIDSARNLAGETLISPRRQAL